MDISRDKKPPYIVVSHAIAPTTYGGQESKFGFVAVFRTENELSIVENISVDCKGDFTYGYNLFLTIEIADDDNKNHLLTQSLSLISLFRYLTE